MPFYLYAWIASITYGLVVLLSKLTSKHLIANQWLFNFVWTFFTTVFTLLFAIFNHVGLPNSWSDIALAGFFGALSSIFYILALYKLDISVLSPLFNFRAIFSVLLGALLLGEILTLEKYVLIAIIFVGGMLVSLDEKFKLKSFFQKYIAVALIMMLCIALAGVFINRAISLNGFWNVTLWTNILTLLLLLPTFPLFHKSIPTIDRKQISIVAIIALIGTLAILAENKAYAVNVGITSTIISLPISMILAFFFSIFAPKLLEKHTFKIYLIRFTAATIMIIAALRLSG